MKEKLRQESVNCEEVTHVVITHGHIDHCGNVNLFPRAQFYMARDIAGNCEYSELRENSCELFPNVELRVLDGHTDCDLVVIVHGTKLGNVAIAGDIFENEDDEEEYIKYSQYPDKQRVSRQKLNEISDFIIPGHGVMFKVSKQK
ncbi:unnamed protein product [Auanema sp. JU1783]|nr:unnamed protein product [Auanema sp. JU1783]